MATGPTLQLAGASVDIDAGSLGVLTFSNPRLEGTLSDNGSRLDALTGGLLGGVVPAGVLYQMPGAQNCPTALHAVLGLLGQPDQDVNGSGLDTVNFTNSWLGSCILIGTTTIDDCTDGETGNIIPNPGVGVDGDCSLDPAMEDGYSVAMDIEMAELLIVEERNANLYCP